jgi:UDP-galactopyranose mutase
LKYDYVIIGAGLAGITMANLLANKDKKILVMEKRDHIGGNCYDEYIDGVLVHKYGPHIFHTNSKTVWDYLSQFTDWNDYKHKVKVSVDGKLITLPINLNSLEQLFDSISFTIYKTQLFTEFGKKKLITIYDLLKSKFNYLQKVGINLYKNIYENYSLKQWGAIPDKSVLKRIPIRLNHNDNYFTDKYQGLPINGYTKTFENMLFHKNIEVRLDRSFYGIEADYKIIYTGCIDELFDYQYGKLPYRSLDFQFEIHDKLYYQKYGVINYPQHESMTRITEFKHLTKQEYYHTVIASEYPKACTENDIPYYPIINEENITLYKKYKQLADKIPNLTLLGRLAEYKYYDMDDVVLKAIKESKKL